MLRSQKSRFLRISKSKSFHDETAQIWMFRNPWGDSFALANWTLARQHSSFFNVSQSECAVPEQQRIDHIPGRHNTIVNVYKPQNTIPEYQHIQVLSWRQCPHLNVSQHEYAIPEHQQINHLAGRHCTFPNDSQPENATPQHQQINLIAGQHCKYFKISHHEKLFLSIRKLILLKDGIALIWTFRSLKMPFLTISK